MPNLVKQHGTAAKLRDSYPRGENHGEKRLGEVDVSLVTESVARLRTELLETSGNSWKTTEKPKPLQQN